MCSSAQIFIACRQALKAGLLSGVQCSYRHANGIKLKGLITDMSTSLFDARLILAKKVSVLKGSILYLDAGAGELLATTVGSDWLVNAAGVLHVCSLETASAR